MSSGSSANLQPGIFDYIPRSGRAFVMPVFKGSYERWDPFLILAGAEYLGTFRARTGQWRQDLGHVIDALGARPAKDMDLDRIAYFGISFGASTMLPLIALEERLKAAVLQSGGFPFRPVPPESDGVNYAAHITIPVLMLGGRHDFLFPLETSQRPLFERLGTPAKDKKHVIFEAGHTNHPRNETIRETLGWLDRYLGPVKSASAARR